MVGTESEFKPNTELMDFIKLENAVGKMEE